VSAVRLPYHSDTELFASNELVRLDAATMRFHKKARVLSFQQFRNQLLRRPGDVFFRSGDESEVYDPLRHELLLGPARVSEERLAFEQLVARGARAAATQVPVPTAAAHSSPSSQSFTLPASQPQPLSVPQANFLPDDGDDQDAMPPPLPLLIGDDDNNDNDDDDDADVCVTKVVTSVQPVAAKPPSLSWIESAEKGVTPTKEVLRGPRLLRLNAAAAAAAAAAATSKTSRLPSDDGRAAIFGNLLYAQKLAAQRPTAGAAAPIEIGDDSDDERLRMKRARTSDLTENDTDETDDDPVEDAAKSSAARRPSAAAARMRQSRLDRFMPEQAQQARELKQKQREFDEDARRERAARAQSSLQLSLDMLRRADGDAASGGAATQLVPLFAEETAFGIYVQYISSCLIDSEFANAIREADDDGGTYFWPALRKIEGGLRDVQLGYVTSSAWSDELRRSLDSYSRYALAKSPSLTGRCGACGRTSEHDRGGELVLSGLHYDSQRLWSHTELLRYCDAADDAPQPLAHCYEIGPSCAARTKLHHALQHWKFHFMGAMTQHLTDKRAQLGLPLDGDLEPDDTRALIDAVCDDRAWTEAQLSRYMALLDDARRLRAAPDE
jgi:hypothetical protein